MALILTVALGCERRFEFKDELLVRLLVGLLSMKNAFLCLDPRDSQYQDK